MRLMMRKAKIRMKRYVHSGDSVKERVWLFGVWDDGTCGVFFVVCMGIVVVSFL